MFQAQSQAQFQDKPQARPQVKPHDRFRVWLLPLFFLCTLLIGPAGFMLPEQSLLAARAPDFGKPDYVVVGKVRQIFKRKSGRLRQYVIQLAIEKVEKGDWLKAGEVCYVYCYQRDPADEPQPDDHGHAAVPKEGQRIRAMIHYRGGKMEGHFPKWFEEVKK